MNSDETTEAVSFGLILHSGNARSYSMDAISYAKSGDWDKAEECLEKGKVELLLAQKTHTKMIQKEAAGDKAEISLLLIHSEDHFMMGQLTVDLANEVIDVYKIVSVEQ